MAPSRPRSSSHLPAERTVRSGDRWRMSNRPGSSGRFSSQWRDRAGLSPASLLGPTWAPGGKRCLAQQAGVAQAPPTCRGGFALTRARRVIDAGRTMRLRLPLLLLATTACVGFNPVSVSPWYPPPDTDTQQLCTGDRASRCTDQALALIDPAAPQKEPDRAARLLGAACEQGDARACKTLDTRFTAPKRLKPLPDDIGHGLPKASASYGEVACTVTVEGEAIKCRGIRNGGYNATYTDYLLRNSYTPAKLDGQPFESEYIERYVIQGD